MAVSRLSTPCLVRLLAVWLVALAAGHQAIADQNSPRLPGLFASLKSAETDADARALESAIWREWHDAPDDGADRLLDEIILLMEAGELRAAPAICNDLVERYPDFAEGWNKRATVNYLLGDHDASVADIQRTLALEPRHFGAISGLGLIFLHRGDLAAAERAYEQVIDISPRSPSAQRTLEQIRARLGEGI